MNHSAIDYPQALPPESVLADYRILQILGHGGFGITYLALDTQLQKQVAIKEYLPAEVALRGAGPQVGPRSRGTEDDFRWGLERFVDEARTLARFRHPNLVPVLRFFQANGTAYMVMEYEHGESLAALLRERTRPFDEAAVRALMTPLLDGLTTVHAAGFLHRDIKPANIIVRPDGVPVLIDFGAARQALGGRSRTLTNIVTPRFAPLEQYGLESRQGPWSDIYSLAAVVYMAITGEPPPDAVSRVSQDSCRRLADRHVVGFSPDFLAAIDWSLEVRAEDRPQSVAEWQAALEGRRSPPLSGEAATRRVPDDRERAPTRRIVPAAEDGAGDEAAVMEQPSPRDGGIDDSRLPPFLEGAIKPTVPSLAAQDRSLTPRVWLMLGALGALVMLGGYRWLTRPVPPVATSVDMPADAVATGHMPPAVPAAPAHRAATKQPPVTTTKAAAAPAPDQSAAASPAVSPPPSSPPESLQASAAKPPAATETAADQKAGQAATQARSKADGAAVVAKNARTLEADADSLAEDARLKAAQAASSSSITLGTIDQADGGRYAGELAGGRRAGLGVAIFADGRRYAGQWKDDQPDGHGVMSWPDGRHYDGEFRGGVRQGLGAMIYPDGRRYEGEWQADRPGGLGVAIQGEHEKMAGDWGAAGLNGYGVATLSDGRRFEGEWRDGRIAGYGIMTELDGRNRAGMWQDDTLTRSD